MSIALALSAMFSLLCALLFLIKSCNGSLAAPPAVVNKPFNPPPPVGAWANKLGPNCNKKSVKVPNHLLVKMDIENNRISKLGVYEANLDECKDSSWYNNGDGKKGNYTTLRFHKNDKDKVTCIYGNLKANRIWCGIELEEINY